MESVSPSDMATLSQKVRPFVWILLAYQAGKYYGHWTGFCVKREGFVMTCAHGLDQDTVPNLVIKARRLDKEELTCTARIVLQKPNWDITLLQIDGISEDCEAAEFSDGLVGEGDPVVHVGNSLGLVGSFLVGYCVYQCVPNVCIPTGDLVCFEYKSTALMTTPTYRVIGHFLHESGIEKHKENDFVDLHPLLPILQCKGLHSGSGASGGPVFNVQGEVIGMLIANTSGCDIAVHASVLRELLTIALSNDDDPKETSQPSKVVGKRPSTEEFKFGISSSSGSSKRIKK